MLHTFFMLIVITGYVTKLVMYKSCSPVMYQLRVRTAGASFMFK